MDKQLNKKISHNTPHRYVLQLFRKVFSFYGSREQVAGRGGYGLLLCLFSFILSPTAYAEWTIAAMGGLAEYTTTRYGDTPFQYPGDIHSNDISGGVTARYLWRVFHPRFGLGTEAGYIFIDQHVERIRYDNALTPPTRLSFTSSSNGVILANVVARWAVVPTVGLAVFGGPAWLNTQYTSRNELAQQTISTNAAYQTTADAGLEINWLFKRQLSLGWRWEYIFNTTNQTQTALIDAQSGVSLVSINLRYTLSE